MSEPIPAGIDPRGPRFAAGITAVLLLVGLVLSLVGISTAQHAATFGWFAFQPLEGASFAFVAGAPWVLPTATLAQRALDPGFLLLTLIALLFLWGAAWPRTAPWGVVFRRLVRPRLAPPAELEDPRPPRFAQGVGLFVLGVGLVLHLIGVPWALPVAAAAAFLAAFLNAAFGFCLGCQIYLLLQRAGIVGRTTRAA
ncbi:DUF4395 domain-containing protein [Microbacterium sp. CIAB417]|uniref:DUF4395 domain-containing protein n=1 Tax=Microbacterium sp. CIAB417 TaxID=2860287 RepID=UPI001FAB80CD|nr:DUF4395 domain-containing protein [Microbacterium sp. CIAB417]